MGGLSIWHILILAVILLLLFGGNRFSSMMGDVAKGLKSFKQGMADDEEDGGAATTSSDATSRLDSCPAISVRGTDRRHATSGRFCRTAATRRRTPLGSCFVHVRLRFRGARDHCGPRAPSSSARRSSQSHANGRLLGRPSARHGAPFHLRNRRNDSGGELQEMEKKWREENERIMQVHSPDGTIPNPASLTKCRRSRNRRANLPFDEAQPGDELPIEKRPLP